MTLKKKLSKIIDLAEKKTSTGSGELSQAIFDEASELLEKEDTLNDATKALSVDCVAYFTNTLIACGALKGFRSRIEKQAGKAGPDGLPQTIAYPLVDLWGRILGIEGLLFEIGSILELARKDGFASEMIKPRMAVAYDLIESALLDEVRELSKQSTLSILGDAIDRLMTMVRSEQRGDLGKALERHINLLPA